VSAAAIRRATVADPEVRIDQLTGLRTILAPARADRPHSFAVTVPESKPDAKANCPFCGGREQQTPLEVWADRERGEPDTPGWKARAVPNLYPALGSHDPAAAEPRAAGERGLSASIDPLRGSTRASEADLFASSPASGAHEVIVHGPEHLTSLLELPDDVFAASIAAWRERMRAHAGASYCQLIVNEGPEAGASREHSHAQLYALDFVPAQVARERERFASYHQRTMGGHLLEDIATEEVRRRERLVAIDDEALLVCPWASRGPFELRLIPRRPAPSFERDGEVGTAMLQTALRALEGAFGSTPQLNLWVRTAPAGAEQFQWHLDLLPRLTIKAGFEQSTGVDINVYPPERAAADLREALS
jgi:UDPglucose--hexose-1-phosphate uridylyltransferase